MKEKLFYEMINLVKIFTFFIIVSSIVVISVRFCETTKTDFKLKNIFRFIDEKRFNKKSKKDFKHSRDNQAQYLDRQNQKVKVRPPFIHTLMPLPLPVHLPLPTHPDNLLAKTNGMPPLPPPPPTHHLIHHQENIHPDYFRVHNQHNHFGQEYNLEHHHYPIGDSYFHQLRDNKEQILSQSTNQLIKSMQTPLLIEQEFNPIAIPFEVSEQTADRISYPVFELVEERTSEPQFEPIRKKKVFRTEQMDHQFKQTDDYFDDQFIYDHLRENKKRVPKQNKTTARLVNNNRFKAIHNIDSNSDEFLDQDLYSRNKLQTNKKPEYSERKQQNNWKTYNKTMKDNDLNSSDNRIHEKTLTPETTVPDEQIINVVEDEWTFKDLDLWII